MFLNHSPRFAEVTLLAGSGGHILVKPLAAAPARDVFQDAPEDQADWAGDSIGIPSGKPTELWKVIIFVG